jgi:hypothetical protein
MTTMKLQVRVLGSSRARRLAAKIEEILKASTEAMEAFGDQVVTHNRDSSWYTGFPPYCGRDCHKVKSKPSDSSKR